MNLINCLVKDIIPFAYEEKLDLHFIVKLIDYRLASITVDLDTDHELETYVSNIKILNTLFISLGLATNYSETDRKAYNNTLLVSLLNEPSRLEKYKEFKLKVINENCASDIPLFNKYIELQ
jgi:hypothetical protein